MLVRNAGSVKNTTTVPLDSLVHVTATQSENNGRMSSVPEAVAAFVEGLQARCATHGPAGDNGPWISHAMLGESRRDADGRRIYVVTFVWHGHR
jgi:hypothetical protein